MRHSEGPSNFQAVGGVLTHGTNIAWLSVEPIAPVNQVNRLTNPLNRTPDEDQLTG